MFLTCSCDGIISLFNDGVDAFSLRWIKSYNLLLNENIGFNVVHVSACTCVHECARVSVCACVHTSV
jgi:hypothetical protein